MLAKTTGGAAETALEEAHTLAALVDDETRLFKDFMSKFSAADSAYKKDPSTQTDISWNVDAANTIF